MKQLERIHRKLAATPQLSSVLTICGLLLVVFASMCLYSESYRSMYNITNVLAQCAPLACVSLGQTLVIISGGIDLSVGSTISVCTAIAARLMGSDNPVQVLLGVVVVFAFAVNGIGVNYLKVPPMITTLCTSTILNGVALWILPVAGGKINSDFARAVYKKWDIISMPLIITVVLFLLLFLRGMSIAVRARDKFGALLAVGFVVQVVLQAVLNIAVVTNTIPNTGISLPFFSSGGTSLMMGEMGIVLSVSRQADAR